MSGAHRVDTAAADETLRRLDFDACLQRLEHPCPRPVVGRVVCTRCGFAAGACMEHLADTRMWMIGLLWVRCRACRCLGPGVDLSGRGLFCVEPTGVGAR